MLELQDRTGSVKLYEGKGKLPEGILCRAEGRFMMTDTLNANGRIYSLPVVKKTLSREDIKVKIQERKMMGQLDHPGNNEIPSLSKVSHLVTNVELRQDGEVRGLMEVVDTPCGRILKALLEAGVGVGVSSRASGQTRTDENGAEIVELWNLVTWDAVVEPSNPGAFPGIVEGIGVLVNETEDHEVLVESKQFLKSLNESITKNIGDSLVSLTATIDEKLSKHVQSVPTSIDTEDTTIPLDERSDSIMEPNVNPGLTHNPQAPPSPMEGGQLDLRAAAKQMSEMRDEYEAKLAELKEDNEAKIKRVGELEAQVTKLSEAFDDVVTRYKTLQTSAGTDEQLKEDNEALKQLEKRARDLIDDLAVRLKEAIEFKKKYEVTSSALDQIAKSRQSDIIKHHVDEALKGFKDVDSVRPLFEGAMTVKDVTRITEAAKSISAPALPTAPVVIPLPGENKPLDEGAPRGGGIPMTPQDCILEKALAMASS